MKASSLYIIGNGFDLWHGIKSSYWSFREYVKHRDSDVFREVEEYLTTEEDWSDLEASLANLDIDVIADNLGHFMPSYGADNWSDSGHHDFQYEVGQLVERLSSRLRYLFGQWIRSLAIPTAASAPRLLPPFDRNAVFLNFNYTSTLSTVYGVPPQRILFIHGCAAQPDEALVLGHAWSPDDRPSLNDHPDVEEMDTRQYEANAIVDEYFSETFKHSTEIIAQNEDFFSSLDDVEDVWVLGHSLAEVDGPYFKALLAQNGIARSRWHVACREEDDWNERLGQLVGLGVEPHMASPFSW